MAMATFSDILLKKQVISKEQLAEAERVARDSRQDVGKTLIRLGYATGEEVMQAIARSARVEYVDLKKHAIPDAVIEYVPESVARENTALPLSIDEDGTLTVIVSSPDDVETLEKLRFILNKQVRIAVAPEESIREAINRYYGQSEGESHDSIIQEFTDTEIDFTQVDSGAGGKNKTTEDSNLYQKADGSWRLRFNERDFKNEKGEDLERGVRNAPYDVPVVPSVWLALTEYLFRHRPVLIESLVDALRQEFVKRGLPALTPVEELAVMRCPYVFRPGFEGIRHLATEQLLAGYGTGQMPAMTLSKHMLSLTSRYLPESKGFCAHACRHLVATEYIKNEPNGWEVAAEALHNTADTVRKHYSWVVVGDRIKPWNDYYERLRMRHDQGEI